MIELERHIEILLLDYECVIVPGLGGFMTHHVEAHYDDGDRLFLPPLRTLGFNPQLKLNDSLLAQSYIEAHDISYPEAIRRIEEEVDELKQHIHNEGLYELNDIGTLYLNEEGNYLFEPCEAGVLTPELYGLGTFEMKKRPEAILSDDSVIKDTQSPLYVKSSDSDTATAVNVPFLTHAHEEGPKSSSDTANESESIIKIKIAWIRNAVAVAVAVFSFFLITPPISNSHYNSANIGGLQNDMFSGLVLNEKATGKMSIDTKQIKKAVEKIAAAKVRALDDTVGICVGSTERPAGDTFCIVVASHVTKSNADAYALELQSEGYSDTYVYVHKGIVRVVFGNYKKESEAYAALHKVRGGKYFEQAWIYKKR